MQCVTFLLHLLSTLITLYFSIFNSILLIVPKYLQHVHYSTKNLPVAAILLYYWLY